MEGNQLLLEKEKIWLNKGLYEKNSSAFTLKISTKTELSLIQKLKDLLSAVHDLNDDDWQDLEHAVIKLPNWFLEKSPQPMTPTEEAVWLKKWRASAPEDQIKMDSEQGWAPADWLYWMNPESRCFFLIGYSNEEECFVFEVSDFGAPIGAAIWMLKITGHIIDGTHYE